MLLWAVGEHFSPCDKLSQLSPCSTRKHKRTSNNTCKSYSMYKFIVHDSGARLPLDQSFYASVLTRHENILLVQPDVSSVSYQLCSSFTNWKDILLVLSKIAKKKITVLQDEEISEV